MLGVWPLYLAYPGVNSGLTLLNLVGGRDFELGPSQSLQNMERRHPLSVNIPYSFLPKLSLRFNLRVNLHPCLLFRSCDGESAYLS